MYLEIFFWGGFIIWSAKSNLAKGGVKMAHGKKFLLQDSILIGLSIRFQTGSVIEEKL